MTEQEIISEMGWDWYNTESSARRVAEYCSRNMYSEKDMQEYAEFCILCHKEGLPCIIAKDWLKQFKK